MKYLNEFNKKKTFHVTADTVTNPMFLLLMISKFFISELLWNENVSCLSPFGFESIRPFPPCGLLMSNVLIQSHLESSVSENGLLCQACWDTRQLCSDCWMMAVSGCRAWVKLGKRRSCELKPIKIIGFYFQQLIAIFMPSLIWIETNYTV